MEILTKRTSKSIGGIVIDAFVTEGHKRQVDHTEYAIESGSTISDHVRIRPDTLDVSGLLVVDINKSLGTAYDSLSALVDKRELVTVVTGLKVYENMVIESLNVDREASTGGSLPFTMTFQRIAIVKSQTATIPKSSLTGSDLTQKQAQPNVDTGRNTGPTLPQHNDLSPAQQAARVAARTPR